MLPDHSALAGEGKKRKALSYRESKRSRKGMWLPLLCLPLRPERGKKGKEIGIYRRDGKRRGAGFWPNNLRQERGPRAMRRKGEKRKGRRSAEKRKRRNRAWTLKVVRSTLNFGRIKEEKKKKTTTPSELAVLRQREGRRPVALRTASPPSEKGGREGGKRRHSLRCVGKEGGLA